MNNEVPAYRDVFITFDSIDKMEEKHKQFDAEADAIRLATIREWDNLFEAIMKCCSKHQQSNCLFNSKMGELLSAHKRYLSEKADQPQPSVENKAVQP